jgi:oligopeptide/dipeptide ABC transporter ATP-binding protein
MSTRSGSEATAGTGAGDIGAERAPLLAIDDLQVAYATHAGEVPAVRGVRLRVQPGETLGLVGESGCGKSSIARAVLGLLPGNATASGSVRLRGTELLGAGERALRAVRGAQAVIVPQGAMSGLDPLMRVGEAIAETLVVHTGASWDDGRERAAELLARVDLPADVARRYPHELSGGMRQRAVIATTLAAGPELVIADEPTTGLDVLAQSRVLGLLAELRAELGLGLVLVSHDLRVVLSACDRVAVLYAGRIVEVAPTDALSADPLHPYTAGLLAALPDIDRTRPWAQIPGASPDPVAPPPGCAFHPRCPHAEAECSRRVPALVARRGGGTVACHLAEQGVGARSIDVLPVLAASAPLAAGVAVLTVTGLAKTYARRRLSGTTAVPALSAVDLTVAAGQVTGLVGASGSGKSTLARIVVGLVAPSGGSVRLDGVEVTGLSGRALRAHRRRVALVHQDPYAALHPAMRVADLVAEPLAIARRPRRAWRDAVRAALAQVGLEPTADLLARLPGQLSGGQRQRVALARALAAEPILLIADEPTSMLDASVRAGIAATLRALRDDLGLAVLLITHDLAEAAHLCDTLTVLAAGRVVEAGDAADVLTAPAHPATRALLSAAVDPLAGVGTERL